MHEMKKEHFGDDTYYVAVDSYIVQGKALDREGIPTEFSCHCRREDLETTDVTVSRPSRKGRIAVMHGTLFFMEHK